MSVSLFCARALLDDDVIKRTLGFSPRLSFCPSRVSLYLVFLSVLTLLLVRFRFCSFLEFAQVMVGYVQKDSGKSW